jgi:hypothetical protein
MQIDKKQIAAVKKSLLKFDFTRLEERCTNEAQTRFTLVEPILEILGYSRIDDMVTEVAAGFGEKNDRADIGLFVNNKKSSIKPEIVVECKRFGKKLTDKEGSQLNNYFNNTPSAKIAILTNGMEWKIYASDINSKETSLNPIPFMEFDLTDLNDETMENLTHLKRDVLRGHLKELLEDASELFFMNNFEDAFFEVLFNPTDELIKTIFNKMGGRKMTESAKSKIQNLINSGNLRVITDRLSIEESKKDGNSIITTAEELKFYHAIKTLLIQRKEISSERISYRDQKNSFLILVDDNQKKLICRLIFTQSKKKVEINGKFYDVEGLDTVVNLKKELTDAALEYFTL